MSRFVRYEAIVLVIICTLVVAQRNGKYYGDPDNIMFPGQISRNNRTLKPTPVEVPSKSGDDSAVAKSLALARKINSVHSVDEFFELIKDIAPTRSNFSISNKMGGIGERSNVIKPVSNECKPELQLVSLIHETDPTEVYYSSCVRVKRCIGCCSHEYFSCQPTETQTLSVEVYVVSIVDGETRKMIVPVEEHTKCSCYCKVQEKHCNEKQVYVPEDCSCRCKNDDEAEKCLLKNDIKIWNPEDCTCSCREKKECSTGSDFDQNTCRCRLVSLPRIWFTPTKGVDYEFGQTQKGDNVPPVIIPLDPTDPRRKPKPDPEYK